MKRLKILACLAVVMLPCAGALFGALSSPVAPSMNNPNGVHQVQPVSVESNWLSVNTAPTTADNSGSEVLVPGSLSRAALVPFNVLGAGTTLQFRLQYATSGTTTTSPTVQVFGFDVNGLPERLYNASSVHDIALTVDTSNDVRDSSHAYSQSQEVDLNGNVQVLVTVKTAASGSAFTSAVIQARVK